MLDPGWLFLVAGLAILCATVLIPAADQLDEAKWLRDRAIAIEQHRQSRLNRYEEYLNALDERDPVLIRSLASVHLNKVPVDTPSIPGVVVGPASNTSPFLSLEPPPLVLPEKAVVESRLAGMVRSDRWRPWLIIGGAVCVLIGLMPPSRGWASFRRKHPYLPG